ncbi:tetratricopeptide (TPR) repeat protein [Amycolatopsis thermophila]|uniref:Tetratricopeptide (TPR) repeat protein n=1 Tax=Amycolatopsis thermophila TaxID=206084 RepID=A0ABU0ET99_9PSEU|nr:tetratricopeptide (TPR) repeat protein [Amycolatopsis thermophila]
MTDLRAYLKSLDPETLAGLLYEQAERDPELRSRLEERAGTPGRDPEPSAVGPVLDTVQRLLDSGTRADVAPLARRTVERISRDEGDGPELRRALGLYARACAARPPDPVELADWLAGFAFDGPGIELPDFAAALGETGLAHLRSHVDKARRDSATRAVAERLHEQLVEISGDVDGLVAILSRQLPRMEASLRIVRVLRAAGRTSEAITYAARALKQDPAATELADDVLGLQRAEFEREPTPERADELIGALAAAGRCDEAAELLEVHRRHVEELIGRKTVEHYREAARTLRRLRTLYRTVGRPSEFAPYLAELVATHRRKVRLITEIRNARIALPKE